MSNMHAVLPALDRLLSALDEASPELTEWAIGFLAHNSRAPVRVVVLDTHDAVGSIDRLGLALEGRATTGFAASSSADRRRCRKALRTVLVRLTEQLDAAEFAEELAHSPF